MTKTKHQKRHGKQQSEFGLTASDVGWEREAEGFVETWIDQPHSIPASHKARADAEYKRQTHPMMGACDDRATEAESNGTDSFPGSCDVSDPHSHIGYVTESDGHTWVTADRHCNSYGAEC